MKRLGCILLFVFGFFGARAQIIIGQKLNKTIKINCSKHIMTSSGSFEKAYTISVDGIKYDITLNPNKTIKSIFTNDEKFSTNDSIKVGTSYGKVKYTLINKMPHIQPGWAKYYISKTGWKIAFDYKEEVADSSKVLFIYQ